MTKLGKKQDAHIVASDAELDAKLEVCFVEHSLKTALCPFYRILLLTTQ